MDGVFAKMNSDAAYRESLIAFCKSEYCEKTLDGWYLWKQKKFTDMVRKYGVDNDYNIPGPMNNVLKEVFLGNTAPTPEKLKLASTVLNNGSIPGASVSLGMTFGATLGPQGATGRFHESKAYQAYVGKKLPIADFKM
jgi:hypothetical protein